MNKVEKALMHALYIHLHHNTDKAIDFSSFKQLNDKVAKTWPGLLLVGPDANDDAGVVKIPGGDIYVVGKLESHNSPCVPTPYDAAATGAGGAMRDVVAMGGRPLFILDFIGTMPLEKEVLVGPCGFKGECTCGKCVIMTSQDRVNLMLKGMRDMCEVMDVFIAGGGFSTSFSDIVPACVVAVIGKLVVDKPLTKPAKNVGDKIILIGETGSDGNDTLYRAGLVSEMRPAVALFSEERTVMDASIAAFETGKIKACSDLGAAGIGAAVCESARYGGLGAKVDLSDVPLRDNGITPEEIMICETQARMLLQVNPEDVDEVLAAIRLKRAKATVIGEINGEDEVVFTYQNKTTATIPNHPSDEVLAELRSI
ncbi:MAG: phosphoribosylformylglycinamidine synthase [Peptococcaceae bacterium]|jgi:phosphoribosylformylglycinamidine synthase|nr:phosphoribosylformylglycinamidine synthase [Peptococcaceae bacterium]